MYIAEISLDVTLYYNKPNQTEPNLERISEDNTDHYVILCRAAACPVFDQPNKRSSYLGPKNMKIWVGT